MNTATATSISPQDPATGAAPEPITAAQRAREAVERSIDTAHPAAPPDVRCDLAEEAFDYSKPPLLTHEEPVAFVMLVISRNRITQNVHLHMGGLHTARRDYVRTGPGSWTTRDPDFIEAEERIGVELAEFVDQLDFPSRVANMLPRVPSARESKSSAVAAVEELRHG